MIHKKRFWVSFLECIKDLYPIMLAFIIVMSTFAGLVQWASYQKESITCDRLHSYGLVTEIIGNYCYVVMDDGTKVLSSDFNIAAVKNPKMWK